jgi:Asp-tRNA(Asn)/Glu-tRNA(Gln) amidotransferase A subunit family amidase
VQPERRDVLKLVAAAGVGSAVFSRALVALAADEPKVTAEMIRAAEWISGIHLTDDQRKLMVEGMGQAVQDFEKMRAIAIDNAIPPALRFDPETSGPPPVPSRAGTAVLPDGPAPARPASEDDLAFATLRTLSRLLRAKKISSVELTKTYLARLRRHDPVLRCVITLTEDLALEQAARADRDLASGTVRGPLHGVPYGIKDLFSVPGYRTTWGATPYTTQVRHEKATVAARLEDAGAVLVAKTTVGELAWGDVWFGGTTKNPWNTEQGSSGSSAGSASATAAGLVGFAIGTETWGSIVSPCTRCGATGLRPTFGRVSRFGAMALAWSMDKAGPIARSVEDCAVVLGAIHGADGLDRSAVDRPYAWPPGRDARTLRIGYVEDLFDADYTKMAEKDEEKPGLEEWKAFDRKTLDTLRDLGFRLVPVQLPSSIPVGALAAILSAEAAAAFDDLTRTGKDATLVRQVADAWPTVFRQGQLIPAVEYVRANRLRTMLLRAMDDLFERIDVYVVPSYGGDNLLLTNLTGHPAVVVPNGFLSKEGTPTSITFQGRLWGEADALAVADAYQQATAFHLRRPSVPKAP